MKHILKTHFYLFVAVLFGALFFNSCANLHDDINEPALEVENNASISAQDLSGSAWFVGNSRIDFPLVAETLYLNYLEDGLNTKRWIRLAAKSNTVYEAEIVWSENIREIGKKSEVQINIDSSKKLIIQSDFLNLSDLESYKGVEASSFDTSKVPALSADYLSNFSGTYTLASTNYTLSVGAKINLSKDVSHYWNANVLGTTYDSETKTYDILLAHSSQKDASGSIDPGINGDEPFITKQGLFWSHLTLTAKPGSQWEIKWASEWKSSPYEALNSALDMQDFFTGPATSKLKYTYKFYFGNCSNDSDNWCFVEKGDLIYSVSFETDLPLNKNWKQIYEENAIAAKVKELLPKEKITDFWWYSTNSITTNKDSYVYKLYDEFVPSLTEYEFYLALADKPAPQAIYTNPGIFYNESDGLLVIEDDCLIWNYKKYNIIGGVQWSEAGKSTTEPKLPLQYCYLVTDGVDNFYCLVDYYVNNNFDYNKFRRPKITNDTVCQRNSDFTLVNKTTKALKKQEEFPKLYFTRSAYWIGQGAAYSDDDKKDDNSNFCYFILNNEENITWVTYPLFEDEEYGEEYRQRQEYSLKKADNGLWILEDMNVDSEDFETSNLAMMPYCDGLELVFDTNEIFVDYKGYLQIKEWYTKVDSEPRILY